MVPVVGVAAADTMMTTEEEVMAIEGVVTVTGMWIEIGAGMRIGEVGMVRVMVGEEVAVDMVIGTGMTDHRIEAVVEEEDGMVVLDLVGGVEVDMVVVVGSATDSRSGENDAAGKATYGGLDVGVQKGVYVSSNSPAISLEQIC